MPTRRRKTLFSGILLLLCMAVAFLAAEAYYRVSYSNIDLWEKTGRERGANPMAEWALVDGFSAYRGRPGVYPTKKTGAKKKTVNSYGFISTPEISPSKGEGVLRIAFLGGSATAGTGAILADDETWPWQAAQMVAERSGRQVDFINAALGGYSSFESYGRLWSRVRFFAPDIVVVNHGWNEMYYFRSVDRLVFYRTLEDGSWTLDRLDRIILGTHEALWIDWLARPSQLLTRLRLRFGVKSQGEAGLPWPLGEYDPRGPEVWRTNLRLIREAARIFGMELFVVRQATLIVPDLPESEMRRCRYDFHGFGHEAHVRAFEDIYRVIEDEIEAAHVIDAARISGRPELFYDHVHPTPDGAAEIARIVAEALLEHLLRAGSPTPEPGT